MIRFGIDENPARLISILTARFAVGGITDNKTTNILVVLKSKDFRHLADVHKYSGIEYFNREVFEELMHWAILWDWLTKEETETYRGLADETGYQYKEFLDAAEADK
ncbi:hypothetical protein K8T06_17725 [bacterium]|nr:hypothetical protein [bacterium]